MLTTDTFSTYTGDTAKTFTFSLSPAVGTFDITGLSGSNFALWLKNEKTGAVAQGTGSFSNPVAASGSTPATIVYSPGDADVQTPGDFLMFVVCTYSSGSLSGKPLTFDGEWKLRINSIRDNT